MDGRGHVRLGAGLLRAVRARAERRRARAAVAGVPPLRRPLRNAGVSGAGDLSGVPRLVRRRARERPDAPDAGGEVHRPRDRLRDPDGPRPRAGEADPRRDHARRAAAARARAVRAALDAGRRAPLPRRRRVRARRAATGAAGAHPRFVRDQLRADGRGRTSAAARRAPDAAGAGAGHAPAGAGRRARRELRRASGGARDARRRAHPLRLATAATRRSRRAPGR